MATTAATRTAVVIAARDAAPTLAQTLDSLLAQTDGDWQAIVVDDGSRDATAQIAATYAARDGRIAVRPSSPHGHNVGLAAARNQGLAVTHSQRVLFLDSDDWIDASLLHTLNAALDADAGAVAAYCNHCHALPDGTLSAPRRDPRVAAAPMASFAARNGVAVHAVLVERAAVQRAGAFDPALRTCEDWDLWQRVTRLGGRWVHVDHALAFYRLSEHAMSRNAAQMVADAAEVIGRGFGADPRLAGLTTAWPHGAVDDDGVTARHALAYFALWYAGLDIGGGGDAVALRQRLADLPQGSAQRALVIDVLLDGLAVGLRAAPTTLAAHWPSFGVRLVDLVATITARWPDPAAARGLQYAVEHELLQRDGLAQPRALGLTMGLQVDLGHPAALQPPQGVDRLVVDLHDGPRRLSRHELSIHGRASARDWLALAADHHGRRAVWQAARRHLWKQLLWRRPLPAAATALGALARGAAPKQALWAAALAALEPAGGAPGAGPALQALADRSAPVRAPAAADVFGPECVATAGPPSVPAAQPLRISGANGMDTAPHTASQDAPGVVVAPPLISIVVPAYNATTTLDETLYSVRAQTHEVLEILVVDDGSTDGTPDIVRRHAAQDPRVRLIQQANGGVAAARNTGWRAAQGALVSFIDADDLWAPTKVERQWQALEQAGPRAALAYCWTARLDEHGTVTKLFGGPQRDGDVARTIVVSNYVGSGSNLMVRRDALLEVEGFDAGLRAQGGEGCEDWLFCCRVALRHHFVCVPEYLVGYRYRHDSMSSNRLQMQRSHLLMCQRLLQQAPGLRQEILTGARAYTAWLIGDARTRRDWRQVPALWAALLRDHPCVAFEVLWRDVLLDPVRRIRHRLRRGIAAAPAPAAAPAGLPFLQGAQRKTP